MFRNRAKAAHLLARRFKGREPRARGNSSVFPS